MIAKSMPHLRATEIPAVPSTCGCRHTSSSKSLMTDPASQSETLRWTVVTSGTEIKKLRLSSIAVPFLSPSHFSAKKYAAGSRRSVPSGMIAKLMQHLRTTEIPAVPSTYGCRHTSSRKTCMTDPRVYNLFKSITTLVFSTLN